MTDDSELNEILHRAALALPEDPDRIRGVRAKRAARARRRAVALASASVVGVALGAALIANTGGSSASPPINGVPEGLRYTVSGVVVHVPGQPDRACPPRAVTLMVVPLSPIRTCPDGLTVKGVDFDAMDNRYADDGAVRGSATLEGVLSDDVLYVTKQSGVRFTPDPEFTTPSCAEPEGGWPRTVPNYEPSTEGVEAYRHLHPGKIAQRLGVHPSEGTTLMYVVTYGDAATVTDGLRGAYGTGLCVVKSRYSLTEGQAMSQDLKDNGPGVGLRDCLNDPNVNEQGEIAYSCQADRLTPDVQALLDRHPKGLLELGVWLRPDAPATPLIDSDATPRPSTGSTARTTSAVDQAVDGSYTASGRVVRVPGQPDRACAPLAVPDVLIIPTPPPATCVDFGVEVKGVDFGASALQNRREQDGAIEGFATITGDLKDGILTVTQQGPPATETRLEPSFTGPPCAAPAGGWPVTNAMDNPRTEAATSYSSSHPKAIAQVAISRPSATQSLVYVLTYADPQPVEDALRPDLGVRLCVARSRFTYDEVSSVEADIHGHAKALEFYGYPNFGTVGEDGQQSFPIRMTVVTPEVQALIARHPEGLITANPWLRAVDS